MPSTSDARVPGHTGILRLAWPIVLANASVPLLGLVDTAVLGHTGETAELGALALGVLLFNFLYWGFGFLRMGTTGFTARADGEGDEAEVRATLGRALLLAAGIGALLLVLQVPIVEAALALFGGSRDVESVARDYFRIRIWGAPATLATFAVMGVFIGLGHTGAILRVQLFLNGLNAVLDVVFAGVLGWGAAGIALGTALAEWTAVGFAAWLVARLLASRRGDAEPFLSWSRILDRSALVRAVRANADIMVRTLLMLFAFAWFTNRSAGFGDATLAANHILLQLVSFSAFFLDGFAHAIEPLVGRALGGRHRALFDAAVGRSTRLAAATAALLATAIFLEGDGAVRALTTLDEVRAVATRFVPWAALYVGLSFAAFQLDGIFIGASRTRDLRNASVVSVGGFLVAERVLGGAGNEGLWLAFVLYVTLRAVTLGARLPALRRQVSTAAADRGGPKSDGS